MTFRVDLTYEGALSACSFSLRPPGTGWTFGQVVSSTFNLTNTSSGSEPPAPVLVAPQTNDVPVSNEGFGFALVTIPPSASSFTFTLKYASGLAGAQQFTVDPILIQDSGQKIALSPATFSIETINAEGVYEADMVGPGNVTLVDWVSVGRIVAGLDTVTTGTNFAKADCAPRATLGDGRLTMIDWVQAGRYAAGLDPKSSVGGPTAPVTN